MKRVKRWRYIVGTNTGATLRTNNRRVAMREWRLVRPRPDAGNKYSASFCVLCPECGQWHDAAPEALVNKLGASQCEVAP